MAIEAPERVTRKPTHIKLTPSQQLALDALRRKLNLSRAGLLEEALSEFFKRRDEKWPHVERRKP